MSLLAVGARCAVCPLVDFLPFTCPSCAQTYCTDHIHSHTCPGGVDVRSKVGLSRQGEWARQARCPMKGCERVTIEAIGGVEVDKPSSSRTQEGRLVNEGQGEGNVAREVRCPGCGVAFCVRHRQQAAHDCPAPPDYNTHHEAFLNRRANAKEVLARTFPNQVGRSISKPPPQRDVIMQRPASPPRLPPSNFRELPASPSAAGTAALASHQATEAGIKATGASESKAKAEKLHDLRVRKLRSLAQPLNPKQREGGRRFFEWGTGSAQEAEEWERTGKLDTKLERVWVLQDTPTGKVLDLIVVISKTARPNNSDPAQSLSLICLHSPPNAARLITQPDLSRPAGEQIKEASVVLLVHGRAPEPEGKR